MKSILVSSIIIVLLYGATKCEPKSKPVSQNENGCSSADDCPENSFCVAISRSSTSGLCLCKVGYSSQGEQCVANQPAAGGSDKPENSAKSQKTEGQETTAAPAPATTTARTTGNSGGGQTTIPAAGGGGGSPKTTGGASPSGGGRINCADYDCQEPGPKDDGNDDPLVVRSSIVNQTGASSSNCKSPSNVPCAMIGGGACYGEACLNNGQGNGYCICSYNRVDRQCAVSKPGKCASGTGKLPAKGYQAQNKRFRHKSNPDIGGVYGRHFADSFDDCVKLCQWTEGSCRSVNYGPLGGRKVCELLSVLVQEGGPLVGWLVDAQGWQYAQCV